MVTRGSGILENFLSKQRRAQVHKFIGEEKFHGSVLDIGCGVIPSYLIESKFRLKYGIDRVDRSDVYEGITIYNTDIVKQKKLEFDDNSIDVITAMAFLEHIYYEDAQVILDECFRVLKKDGILVLTTPNRWTDQLLRMLAKVNIVSKEEIEEHKVLFTKTSLMNLLVGAGFDANKIQIGTFELGMNLYGVAHQ